MTEGIEAIGARGADDVRVDDGFAPEQLDEAREKALRARLADSRHPIGAAEWQAIKAELQGIKQRRETRAYAAAKQPSTTVSTDDSHGGAAPIAAGSLGLATMLAVQSGIMWNVPARWSAPPMVPLESIRSGAELAKRIADERAFLASAEAKILPPMFRAAREKYLADLNALAKRAITAWAASPEGRAEIERRLYAELAGLGDKTCRPGDNVETLVARRNTLIAERARAANAQIDASPTMGLDGRVVPNAQAYSDYVVGQYVDAMGGGGTGIGQALATIQVMRGGSIEEMRAAAQAGQQIEGMGGGEGTVVDAKGRATPVGHSTKRPTSGQRVPEPQPQAIATNRSTEPKVPAPTGPSGNGVSGSAHHDGGLRLDVTPPSPVATNDKKVVGVDARAAFLVKDKISKINGQLSEMRGYEAAVRAGEISVQPPGDTNAPGPDYITFDPRGRGTIVVYDAKFRASPTGYPKNVPATTVARWKREAEQAIERLPDGPMKDAARDAFQKGRIGGRVFRGPHGQ